MKKIRKKIALICLLCFSFLLTGCKIGNKEVIVSIARYFESETCPVG